MADDGPKREPLDERTRQAVEFLEELHGDYSRLAELDDELRKRLLIAAGRVARPGPWAKRELMREARRRRKRDKQAADERALARTGIRATRRQAVFPTPMPALPAPLSEDERRGSEVERVIEPRNCYVCKKDFHQLHHFYDQMCPECAELNWHKRHQSADVRGRVALVTGSRVKIGYQAAIMLLRAGAEVIVTTRFPADAAARYAREADFDDWGERLSIYGLDLRHTPSVETLCRYLADHLDRLDFIINNACQTVRRPSGFYDHLMAGEKADAASRSERERALLSGYQDMRAQQREALTTSRTSAVEAAAAAGITDSAALAQLALLAEDLDRDQSLFPTGQLDADLQQVDLRGRNSWRLALDEVSAVELLEVQLVNAVAPFILNARLKQVMLRQPSRDKHIVNVSAMEGQFYRRFKTDKHPHTNMAKAALNMMTRTSAADYIKDGIHMNSVDTGWVTDEDPMEIAKRKTEVHRFHPPLDIVDGAARIVDPIFEGVNTGNHQWGLFLKDYKPTEW
ncbi:MAG: SDR family oxidoreductase [Deltaproteobacteria bacterium]|nr:SDR family oxidoreductase [Deltaproteobacteria bacterium]